MSNNTAETFRKLRIEGWRQFDSVDIELHERLTVLTGANGAGKSSLLRIFSRHFGFDRPFLATPRFNSSGTYTYFSGIFESLLKRLVRRKQQSTDDVGTLTYSNGIEGILQIPKEPGIQYAVQIANQQPVIGIHIDSHQAISFYQGVAQIPTNLISPEQAYNTYNGEIQNRFNGSHSQFSPIYRMKEAIISMATFGEGNKYVQGNREILDAYLGFVEVLRKLFPESLGFLDLAIRPPEIVLVTRSGEFVLDACSGGLMTLIDIAWRLFMFSRDHNSFVVTMDEPENHLHPTMQRSLMRRLLAAFPKAQFIIATHSPFMVSSIRDSNVYVLRYVGRDSEKTSEVRPDTMHSRVISERLDTVNKAGNASEILREVLGVSATMPEWVEEDLVAIVAQYRQIPITPEALRSLRNDLSSRGYGELYPNALASLTEGK
jgi:hypothetical protein